jgi:hypothetical protein
VIQFGSNPHDDSPGERVDIIKREYKQDGKFKKRAVSCAEGGAPIAVAIQIHVERQKVNKERVNLPCIFVCNCPPLIGKNLHTDFVSRPHLRGFTS